MNAPALLLGRILLSVIFIVSGFGKLTGAAGFAGYLTALGFPAPLAMAYLVGLFELLAGIAVLVGYQTRIAGYLLAAFCVATALLAHSNFADQAQMINFMKNLGLAGGFLVLAGAGAGAYSLDARTRPLTTVRV